MITARRHMPHRRISKVSHGVFAGLLLGAMVPAIAASAPQDAPSPTPGLESIYDPGFLLEDRNGDGHLDFVRARLALPATPSDIEVVAAANVAARLGYETSSMDLPIRRAAEPFGVGAPVIAIGFGSIESDAVSTALASALEPGLGTVTLLPGDAPVVLVAGGDAAGMNAAALALAARLPHIWAPDGATLESVTTAIRERLGAASIDATAVSVRRLAVRAGTPGMDRLDVEVTVPPGTLDEALRVLRESDDAEPAGEVAANEGPEDQGGAAADEPPADQDAAATEQRPEDQDAAATEESEGSEEQGTPPALRFDGLRLLRISVQEPAGSPSVVWVSNPDAAKRAGGRRPGGGNKADLDLSNLYSNQGFFSDTDSNLIPDRVDVVLSPAGDSGAATADLAARLGLEAAGVTLPIALSPADVEDPENKPPLVLIGRDHPLIQQLVDDETIIIPELEPGQGWIRVVHDAFDEKTALVVIGADDAGLDRAIRQIGDRLPYLWERGKDRPTVEDVEDSLWRAVSSRSPLGQAATALYKLETLAARIDELDLESVKVIVHTEKTDPALQDYVRARAAELFDADTIEVEIDNIDVQNAKLLIDEEIEIPSEVDAFWRRFNAEVLPAVQPGEPVTLLALLSEPPEIREEIAARVRRELVAAGASESSDISVLSAYKQGYSWLYDRIRPQLEGQAVQGIKIRFAEVGAPEEWPQQAMFTPTRWLLEIFPIDEVLARDLGLDLEQIAFEKMPKDAPAYEVIVTGVDGEEILRETFEPRWVLRDYFDRFPDYEKARVTTGWIRAEIDGDTVIDERIVTDLEAFWDHFQGDTLMRIYDYVMANGDGKPRASDAPHFGELRIDVTLSEPDYQVGVDKEQIASMEALHEEIYFGTLHFFDVLGRLARGQALNYPGRVIPIVRPKADGAAGSAKITFTGFGAPRPRVVVEYTERGARPAQLKRDIPKVAIDRPEPLEAFVRDGFEGIEKLGFYVKVDFEKDRRDEFARRTNANRIDASITNAEQVAAIIENAGALREAGLYPAGLAFHGLGTIDLTVGWERERSAETEVVASLPDNGSPTPLPDIAEWLPDDDAWRDGPLVQWDTPMPPGEAYQVLAKMQTFPGATAYQVGESYLGKQIWALDIMAPLEGSHWSQAKATTLKPTVIYSARQHANEVSSTSHVLKLAEIVLNGDEYPDALDKVNIVIHPITNPDGAQLAYDLHQITPDHMLHAGYLGSLGVDVTSGQGNPDPMYPETKVRPKLWQAWLPDIFLNPHGYPSHEWVQVFSEYAGWVRTRATESRSWWGMRGWFMPGFSYLDDPRYPDHKAAAFEIRDRITAKINAIEDIRALNVRAYDRYRRYAFAFDPDAFKLDFTDGVLIYTPIVGGTGRNGTMSNPNVTVWSGTTEAPDETAYGEWLEMVATAGLEWDKALLEYLLEGNHEVNRTKEAFAGGVTFKVDRPRPAKLPEDEEEQQQPVSQQQPAARDRHRSQGH